jgi:2-iminobutanoate/2-iminopropanoate deaminase
MRRRQNNNLKQRLITAPDAPQTSGRYSQAVEVTGAMRMLYVSGQIPIDAKGQVPEAFADQARLTWTNIEAQLRAADMGLGDIVKVTTFLSDRIFAEENSRVRREVLGGLAPALTVIICGIYDPAWLLEIEVVAAA